MRKLALTLSASALVLAGSISGPSAHQAGGPMMQQGQQGAGVTADPDSDTARMMMGPGMMMGAGMMGHGMTHMMMVMMDTDGDGGRSLDEFQDVHARMFNAMDANKDGKLMPEEMQDFMQSGGAAPDEAQ